jgi:hypothetical protein
MRIYWDRVLVGSGMGSGEVSAAFPHNTERAFTLATLEPLTATLRWRGFSAESSPDGREPFGYDYERVSSGSPWKLMPGRYTREGDVHELLTSVDDMFVVSRPGDEIALSFDATTLPPLSPGWTRTFLLYADGFSKEMDPHSSSPDQLAPLPFHSMTRYPYTHPEQYPDDRVHRDYLERYNTRVVLKAVPRIDATRPTEPNR